MHTDEAVVAVKASLIARDGGFEYDPSDYHGPTLHYSILGFSKLLGKSVLEMNERDLRLVSVFWGMMIVVLFSFPWFRLEMGPCFVSRITTGFLFAVSPAFVFYSRYLIMEEILVFFSLIFLLSFWRAWISGKWAWVAVAGAAGGLMHATKETALLMMVSVCVGAILTNWLIVKGGKKTQARLLSVKQVIGGVVIGLVASAFAISDGFRNWHDVWQSYTTYFQYLDRSEGAGHDKPFWYYAGLLSAQKNGIWWGEWPALALCLLGGLALVIRKRWSSWVCYLGVVFLGLFLVYSFISYKTPWCVLSMLSVLFVICGFFISSLVSSFSKKHLAWPLPLSFSALVVLLVGVVHWDRQNRFSNRYFGADSRNPWVYSHTSTDVFSFTKLIEEISDVEPEFDVLVVQKEGSWPFPWYFRNLKERVIFSRDIPNQMDQSIVCVGGEFIKIMDKKFPNHKKSIFGLRPGVIMTTYFDQNLWDKLMKYRNVKK